MIQVELLQAKIKLAQLIAHAEAGEEVIIARSGKPVVKLVKIEYPNKKRDGGQWRGLVWVSDDFDDPDPEVEKMFYDGPIFPDEEEPKP
ncbi:MAG: type II toxin-antitoxin system prevent-host-death family antitoxin [Candidatus Hydrogenedentota bacterium]